MEDLIELLKLIATVSITAIITIVIDKYLVKRPRVELSFGKVNFSSSCSKNGRNYEFTYCFQCLIKNNSNNTGFNIKLKPGKKAYKLLTEEKLNNDIYPNLHLNGTESKTINLCFQVNVPVELVMEIKEEVDRRIIGSALYSNPEKHFYPDELKNFDIVIQYKNEKNISFYTQFNNDEEIEKNSFHLIDPSILDY